jgi:hypothetical protein
MYFENVCCFGAIVDSLSSYIDTPAPAAPLNSSCNITTFRFFVVNVCSRLGSGFFKDHAKVANPQQYEQVSDQFFWKQFFVFIIVNNIIIAILINKCSNLFGFERFSDLKKQSRSQF